MIVPISTRPKTQNNYAKGVFVALLASATALTVFYFTAQKYRGVIGFVALCLITAVVFIYTKYISQSYIYDITEDSDGSPIFVVRAVTGKRESTMCRIDLSSIISVEKETAEQKRAHKTEYGFRKYVYTPTMLPPIVYRITVKSRYERAEIIIECTDEFCEYLLSASQEARELYSEDEE